MAEEQQRTKKYDWDDLEKLDTAIAWRRDLENASLAHVWHLDTLADLAASLRYLLLQREIDERLISLLWNHVPGDDRVDVAAILEAPGNRFPGGSERLGGIAGQSA